jgi:hypothetical protein
VVGERWSSRRAFFVVSNSLTWQHLLVSPVFAENKKFP